MEPKEKSTVDTALDQCYTGAATPSDPVGEARTRLRLSPLHTLQQKDETSSANP